MDMLASSALEADSSLPSFFEMFMTQQVEQSLKPAARHAHSALALRWPSLHRLSPWFDEAFLVLSLLVEAKFLSNHSSLLSESFYGLRRCRYGPKSGPPGPPTLQPASSDAEHDAHVAFDLNGAGYGQGQGLRARDRRKALLMTAALPYLLAKLDAGHERSLAARAYDGLPRPTLQDEQPAVDGAAASARRNSSVRGSNTDYGVHGVSDGGVGAGRGAAGVSRSSRRDFSGSARRARAEARRRFFALRQLFFQVYPLLRASYEGSCLVYQWLYLFRRSAFFSPALRLTGMVVRRATIEDWQEDAEAAAAAVAAAAAATAVADPSASTAAGGPSGEGAGGGGGGGVGGSLGDRVARYGRVLLITAVVAFKIVEWWNRVESQEGSSWRRSQLPPPPPPPQPPLAAPGGCGVPSDSGACPACGGARVNPALCAASGFVFCYGCLSAHVREHGECPVTGLACQEEGIVRLFDDDETGGGGGAGA
ncbi:unnamed protein product [Ectocarpus sp. 6 AP-2014]